MATFNTRIQNKIDTYQNWFNNNPTPLNGEICIVTVPADTKAVVQEPAILIKVGNGTDDFKTLPFISGKAADVSNWALADKKPTYTAEEIEGLADYISGEIQDTDTQYSFALAENYKIKIQKKDLGGEYADYQVIDLTSAFNAKADKVANAIAGNFAGLDAEGNLTDSGKKAADFATADQGAKADSALQKADIASGSANGTIAVEGTDVAVTGLGSAAFTDADAYAAKGSTEAHIADGDIHVTADLKTAWNTAAQKAGTNESAINAIKNGATIVTFKGIEEAIAAEAERAAGIEGGLETRLKAVEDDYLKAADKTELQGNITTVSAAVERLTNGVSAEEIDGVNDLIEYVNEHGAEVKGMQEDIAGVTGRMTTAEGKITAVEEAVATKAEKADVEAAIEAIPPTIIDVVELPTENIREDVFYRVMSAHCVNDGVAVKTWICYCVESLPEVGHAALSGDMSSVESATVTAYYNISDGGAYGYVTDDLAGMFGVSAGWYPVSALMTAVGFNFGGIITNILDAPWDGAFRILLERVVYSYKDIWTSHKVIGWAGTGFGAEVFNSPLNTASGSDSHAEGNYTTASGDRSHAEGYSTTAEGENQHVQGKYNIADTTSAHIVGNGTAKASSVYPSNAHTLDWSGNAWFAGDVYVGSTSGTNKDDGSKILATREYADGLNSAMNERVEALEAIDHDHANAGVLDGISAEKVAQWDAAQANVLEGIAGVEGSVADKTFTVSGISTDLLKQGTDVIIFNCGDSAGNPLT